MDTAILTREDYKTSVLVIIGNSDTTSQYIVRIKNRKRSRIVKNRNPVIISQLPTLPSTSIQQSPIQDQINHNILDKLI